MLSSSEIVLNNEPRMPVCPNCHEHNPELGAACPRCQGYHYIPDRSVKDAENDPMIGKIAADKYVVLELINEGGMGAVYRALQLPVEREIALKVLRTELKDSDQAGDRFIREARAVSRLNHPNIITLYDFGFDSNRHPYMVMEYAPGMSLARWIKNPDMTIERIIHVTHQILSALTEAHKRGIVHRDLKPDNMIVTHTGSDPDYIKLLDFGIARMINEGSSRSLTREGEVFGTPHYMAPEQAQGSKAVGPPADVYAVGIMLYEMLTGECPFDAPTPLAVLFMHINDELPAIKLRDGLVNVHGLDEIVRQATDKDPKVRYQTASEMLAALTDLVASFGSGLTSLAHMQDLTGDVLIPGRIPKMTPMPDADPTPIPATLDYSGHDVSHVDIEIDDPDESILYTQDLDSGRSKKIAFLAVGLLLFVGFVGGAIAVSQADSTDAAEKPVVVKPTIEETTENTEKPDETEVAVKENNEAVVDEHAVATIDENPPEENTNDVVEETGAPEKVVEKPIEKPKKEPKKTVRKKKTSTKTTPKKTKPAEETKPKETKKEPKKTVIKKFKKKPTKFDPVHN